MLEAVRGWWGLSEVVEDCTKLGATFLGGQKLKQWTLQLLKAHGPAASIVIISEQALKMATTAIGLRPWNLTGGMKIHWGNTHANKQCVKRHGAIPHQQTMYAVKARKGMSDYHSHKATSRVEGQYLLENGGIDSIVF